MKLKYLIPLAVLLLAGLASAFLGEFAPGEDVHYSVVCVSDDGTKDKGCTGNDDDILPGNDTAVKAPTTALAEVSDANFPGLWRGKYTVPAGAYIGNWQIFIELTNSNSTLGATVESFKVVNYTLNILYGDMIALDSNVDAVHVGIGTNQSYSNTSFSNWFNYINPKIDSIHSDMGLNFTNVSQELDNIDVALSAVDANVSDSNFGQNATMAYLIGTIFDYMANHIQNFMNATLYTDMGKNFTNHSVRFDTADSDLTGVNKSVSDLMKVVNVSIADYGDQQWTTALTSAQNDTLYGIADNVSILNSTITEYGDQQWAAAAAFTAAQNASLHAIEANVSDSNYGLNASFDYLVNTFYTDVRDNFTNVSQELDNIDSDLSDINHSLNLQINATPGRVWNGSWAPDRILTVYPVGAIATISLVDEGFFNATYYNSEVGHVIGGITPENELRLTAGRWARNDILIENLPSNITHAELCLWVRKVGNPTGNLGVYMNDTFLYNLSVADFTTSFAKNCTIIGEDNITNYNAIILRGESGWSVPNRVEVGMDTQASLYSYDSVDSGATWAHTLNELVFWIEVTAYSKSIADQINEKVVNIETLTPADACVGEPINFHWAFYDFKGEQLAINSMPGNCNVYYYTQNGSEINITGADVATRIENNYIAWAFWNNTEDESVNRSYHIDCNGISVTPPRGTATTVDVDALFGFTEECNLEGRFNAVYGNQSEIDSDLAGLSLDMGENFTNISTSINDIDSYLESFNSDMAGNATRTYNLLNNVWQFLTNSSMRDSVWSAGSRTLTSLSYHIFGNWSLFQDNVWNATDRNLTFYGSNISIGSIWNYGSVADRNVTSSNERGTDSAELESAAAARYTAIINNISDANASLSGLVRAINVSIGTMIDNANASITGYMVTVLLPEVDNVEELVIAINLSLDETIRNVGGNVSLAYEIMTNGSLDASVIEYLHRQNVTHVSNYNVSETWWLENETLTYSDGVRRVLTFDYNDNGQMNKTVEETY